MRKPLIAGNWKMHGSTESARQLAADLANNQSLFAGADMVVFPPSVYLAAVAEVVAESSIAVGGQNLSPFLQGAHTGEIAASMLTDVNCKYVLVGHSERRTEFAESNEAVAEKFKVAQQQGLTPVLCVGESLSQRQQGVTLAVVREQLAAVQDSVGIDQLCQGVIAYEPIWAIGTGEVATPEQAQAVHAGIREQLGNAGIATRLLYGGSVKSSNAAELFAQPDIDGGLVGGASLQADEFLKIAQLILDR